MTQEGGTFQIGIAIYEGVDLLDVAAPYEVFNWMKESLKGKRDVSVKLLAAESKVVGTRDKLPLTPQMIFHDAPQLDLLWVPGGSPGALGRMMQDAVYQGFIKEQAVQATYVVSVCEGALILAAAGLLDGFKVTTHWAFIPCLKPYRKIKVAKRYPRFVVNKYKDQEKRTRYVVTGGGISSGLDESLELVKLIAGKDVAESVQVTTQYFPKPPVKGKLQRAKTCPPLTDDAG
ncbi:MAG: DJ-1/PfpI family protein [Acidobacteria bacterium]|nr:DJ-1/PfpI family protein [Acidobacteriota bacterium]